MKDALSKKFSHIILHRKLGRPRATTRILWNKRRLVQSVTNIHKGAIGINPFLAITGCIATISKDRRLQIGINDGRMTPLAMAL